ncbi:probable protein CHAPERONE-LIKE PROTEIN OF POR1, chloroplastic [Coccomyxa sp. Obi]|nr:probable protein CHAPERONE-LIKE PROTEIN OF POR1, chloroplastic [Coccomyxa sp. Obi]
MKALSSSRPPKSPASTSSKPSVPACSCSQFRRHIQRPWIAYESPSIRRRWKLQHQSAVSAGELSSADLPPESGGSEQQEQYDLSIDVFPRLHEKDPYSRLGLSREASFEEVQDARNYLYETYKRHERSREAIELAYDSILQERMKVRHKYGFQPPRRGRKSDLQGDALPTGIIGNIKERLEPSVPLPTIVNDGSIFVMMGLWAAWQTSTADPSLPVGAALCFSVWRLFDKRKKRAPESGDLGRSPIWGAVGVTLFGLFLGSLVSWALVRVLSLPRIIRPDQAGLFIINIVMGLVCIFFK